MPGIIRKLLIFAAADGLVLQPISPHRSQQRPLTPIKIEYGSHRVRPLLDEDGFRRGEHAIESHGVIGTSIRGLSWC